jgi:hypothetical protein
VPGTSNPMLGTGTSVGQTFTLVKLDFCEIASGRQQETELGSCLFCGDGVEGWE